MFEALLLIEDPNDVFLVLVDFQGVGGDFEPFSINGMGHSDVIDPVTGDVWVIIVTDQTLNPNGTTCEFQLVALATGVDTQSETINVTVHKRGKLLFSSNKTQTSVGCTSLNFRIYCTV